MSGTKRTALVTGASGGIGYELSKLLAADGYDLVLVARSEQKLREIAKKLRQDHTIEATILAKDLSDPTSPSEIWRELQERDIAVDILCNNAGYGTRGRFYEQDLSRELNMLQLNAVTLTHLTGLFLPSMVERGFGRILNVGSTGSFQPGPQMAVYCASKAYVLHFSEAIAEEVRGTGVSVTALCPGVTWTGFQERAKVEETLLVRLGGMSAARVAEIAYRALMRGRPLIVPGWMNKLMVQAYRFLPRRLLARMARITLA
jgi:short-subunit dehydrogenase